MFDGKYLDWNQKRIKGIIDFYGHKFFFGKKVLDLGCGYADISCVLQRLGSEITAVDARQEHLKMVSKKYAGIKTVKADLDRPWPFISQKFDLVLDLDLICHINNYESHLKSVCGSCTNLIIETAVCDSDDPNVCVLIPENKNIYDLSVNGFGSRPSAAAIEKILTNCNMDFTRLDQSKFNSGKYVYDWKSKNDNSCDINNRRLWIASKKNSGNQIVNKPVVTIGATPVNLSSRPSQFDLQFPPSYNIRPNLPPENTKDIKVALCISGHLRTFESNFESVKQYILSKFDCDVFIHTWDIMGMPYRQMDRKIANSSTNNLITVINNLYKPKKLIIEPSKPFRETPIMRQRMIDNRDIPGILSMYYKIEACNKIKRDYEDQNHMKYDFVIRFRGDLFMEQTFPISKSLDTKFIYFPTYGNFGGLNDQLAFGSSPVMDIYSSLYSNINSYMTQGAIMNPEKLLKFHIGFQNLPVSKIDVNYVIKRANGLVQNNYLLEKAWGFIK